MFYKNAGFIPAFFVLLILGLGRGRRKIKNPVLTGSIAVWFGVQVEVAKNRLALVAKIETVKNQKLNLQLS